MRILGLDPGLAILGFGIIDEEGNKLKLVDYGIINSEPDITFPERLKLLYDDLDFLINRYKPDIVAVEELFYNRNATTAIKVAQARGVQVLCCQKHNLPLYEFTPLQVKQTITGYGRADKKQVQLMVKNLLNMDHMPQPDDAADAIAIAICLSFAGRFKDQYRME
ncbi:crossover junction endodeoxyribonuclease RuvC [uncultured Ezakiella sp.]|uniref:crossover junction endodeoxyribonuclease RuvC n=1 Tax=uncultured Ezakiella sp. TaxID=1637529 RepID=UPI0025E915B3|nr:crossover junction endodeoxyribonuclease RuvC [uncultured Ezakiella sp.]